MSVLAENEKQRDHLNSIKPFKSVKLLEIQRVQRPQTLSFRTRMIFYVKLNPNIEECCPQVSWLAWITIQDLSHGLENLWGPELVQYSRVVGNNFESFCERFEEFRYVLSFCFAIFLITLHYSSLDDVYLYTPRDPPRNAEERMLSELNISEKTIEILYNDFLDHCWPCFSLPIDSFKNYLSKYGFKQGDSRFNSLFLAFNYMKNGFVSFHELLLGLVSLEPQAIHHETRIKFVFRFYDTGSKGFLDMDDFSKLVADLTPNGQRITPDKLQACTSQMAEAVGITVLPDSTKTITYANFMEAIANHRLRGTSSLCRSRAPVFLQLTRAFIHRKRPQSNGLQEWNNLKAVLVPRSHKGLCRVCKTRGYKLATHVVGIDAKGYVTKHQVAKKDNKPIPGDQHSIEFVFNDQSISNVLLRKIRQFAKNKGTVDKPRGLLDNGPNEQKLMLELMENLTTEVKKVLESQDRLPNVTSPVYVIGDIHGNLEDLLTLEKMLWRSAPCLSSNYLFLGDYVDRGKWGLEVIIVLLVNTLHLLQYFISLSVCRLFDCAQTVGPRQNHSSPWQPRSSRTAREVQFQE